MPRLVVNIATRNRPALVLESIQRIIANIVEPDTILMVSADADDFATIDLLSHCNVTDRIKLSIREREDTIAEKWNRAVELFPDAAHYMPLSDHTYPTSRGFDAIINEAGTRFPDGIYAVHTQLANLSFAASEALSAKWVKITGQIYPTYFPYWFVDHWTDDLARITQRIAFTNIGYDDSRKPPTQEFREPGWWGTFYDALHQVRAKQALELLNAMDEPEWRKANLKAGIAEVDRRSRGVNDAVRKMPQGLPTNDERYQRVRQRAVAMLTDVLTDLPPVEALAYRNALLPPSDTVPNIPRVGVAA